MPDQASHDTRTRLLEAAARLIWRRSFHATGVDELCREAGVKKGSFYHFFHSKTELAIAAIEEFWHRVRREVYQPVFSSEASGLEQLQALLDRLQAFQIQAQKENGLYLGSPFGSLGQEMACQDERLRLCLEKICRDQCEYIELAIKKAIQDGDIAPGNNPLRAQRIFALLEGAILLAKLNADPTILPGMADALHCLAAS